jgi:2-iminobutanoate/2-iminopropanoate deaminase
MAITRISSGTGVPTGFAFSAAAQNNGTLYISGVPSLDDSGKFWPGTFHEEADRAWAGVVAIAAAAGYTPDNFAFVQVLLSEIEDYNRLNEWWRGQYPDPAKSPARLAFQAAALPFGAKIEFQVTAVPSG